MRKLFVSLILFSAAATSFAWSGSLKFIKGDDTVILNSDGDRVCLQKPHTSICAKNIAISDYFFLSPAQTEEYVIKMMKSLGYSLV